MINWLFLNGISTMEIRSSCHVLSMYISHTIRVRCIYLHLVDLYTIYYAADSMGIYTHIVCVRLLFSNSSSWSTTVRCDDKKSCLSLGGMWYIPKIAPENTRVIKLRILGVLNNTFPETSSLPLKIDHPKRKFIFQPSILRCYICYFQGG